MDELEEARALLGDVLEEAGYEPHEDGGVSVERPCPGPYVTSSHDLPDLLGSNDIAVVADVVDGIAEFQVLDGTCDPELVAAFSEPKDAVAFMLRRLDEARFGGRAVAITSPQERDKALASIVELDGRFSIATDGETGGLCSVAGARPRQAEHGSSAEGVAERVSADPEHTNRAWFAAREDALAYGLQRLVVGFVDDEDADGADEDASDELSTLEEAGTGEPRRRRPQFAAKRHVDHLRAEHGSEVLRCALDLRAFLAEDVLRVERGMEPEAFPKVLPTQFTDAYNLAFYRKFLVAVDHLCEKLLSASDRRHLPSCTAEEIALGQILDMAEDSIATRDPRVKPSDAERGAAREALSYMWDEPFWDLDYQWLFDSEMTASLAQPTFHRKLHTAGLAVNAWFDAFNEMPQPAYLQSGGELPARLQEVLAHLKEHPDTYS